MINLLNQKTTRHSGTTNDQRRLIVGVTGNTGRDVVYRAHGSVVRSKWFEERLVS